MKYFKIFLTLVLFTTGCGTTYKSFPPADIAEQDSPLIENPILGQINQKIFDKKISEIKGKIKHYHSSDPIFIVLYDRAEELSKRQDGIRVENNERTNNGACMGGLLIPLLTGGYATSKKDPNSENDLEGFKFILALPGIIVLGAAIGFGISEISNGADLTEGHKKELIQLIDDYNSLNIPKAAPDTVAQPQP